ncbi:NTP transferase domain-containing protein [Ferrimonas balearica]|uniref:nucleotidyltransferase family protein n=1 Tax=Ferrimonas balearica TaxID=44012 RepID=UPI001C9A1078|nr:nucleotidyltransferase family protein [Ferrimonas balearica]MBY5922565.1 nucleotidyltransferase family protein [Ferrimonas balearica]MBY5995549.1 nucleotidyltransferase family protein [Ferrimonas balearica]
MAPVTALLMAAGQSTRFGSNKLLSRVNGHPLIQHSLSALKAVLGHQILVVLGHDAEHLIPLLGDTPFLIAPEYQKGLGHSIATGVSALAADTNAVLIALADQVGITEQNYCAMVDRYLTDGHPVCARYNNGLGIPAIFPKPLFPRLMMPFGDKGAGVWLAALPGLNKIEMPGAALDIDTPDDLLRFPPTPPQSRTLVSRFQPGRKLWR